jgi:hypothetical protein
MAVYLAHHGVILMLLFLPPAIQESQPGMPQLPWFGDSDPRLMRVYEWTLAHSETLRRVVAKLPRAEPKARFRLQPGGEVSYGKLLVQRTKDTYDLTLVVPVKAWQVCGDALEPWVASTFFLALECAERGEVNSTRSPRHYTVSNQTGNRLFAFQSRVRFELAREDSVRLGGIPDSGRALFESRFSGKPATLSDVDNGTAYKFKGKVILWRTPDRRPLPENLDSAPFTP